MEKGSRKHPRASSSDTVQGRFRTDLLGLPATAISPSLAVVLGVKWSSICRARLALALHQLWPSTIPCPAKCQSPCRAGM